MISLANVQTKFQENRKANILIVEDDVFLQDGLSELLGREDYSIYLAATLAKARQVLEEEQIHMMILDVGLPDGDGYHFCQEVRSEGKSLPILFLTARDEEYELVRGLDVGGDDYLAKPFRAMELTSRIRALIRRLDLQSKPTHKSALDFSRLQYSQNGEAIPLTPTEFFILQKLLENPDQVLSRQQLLDSIWDQGGQFIDDNTLSVHVSRLREKIGKESIVTIRGIGYRWRGK